jgi:hypothetical protein
MGNCAIHRTAYIGGVLLLLQVFFNIFRVGNTRNRQNREFGNAPERKPMKKAGGGKRFSHTPAAVAGRIKNS